MMHDIPTDGEVQGWMRQRVAALEAEVKRVREENAELRQANYDLRAELAAAKAWEMTEARVAALRGLLDYVNNGYDMAHVGGEVVLLRAMLDGMETSDGE